MYDYSKLSGRIVEFYGTQYKFSNVLGLSERSVSLKMNGKVPWKDVEISKACELLDINIEDVAIYFFRPKVQEVEQKAVGV